MARVSRSSSALRRIDGADPYLEIGGITEVAAALPDCPALLFDRIKGYPKGLRILTIATTNVQRAALALGIDPTLGPFDALKAWMEVRGSLELRKPVQVDHAHFLENSDVGDTVDLSKFPVPHWHLKDGGPYIGSGSHPTGTEAVGRYFAFEDDHRCVQTLRMAQPVSGDLGNAPLKRRERSKKNDAMCWPARFEVINRIQLRGRTG